MKFSPLSFIVLSIVLGLSKLLGVFAFSWSTVALPMVFLVGVYFGSLSSYFHRPLGRR
jgi:hypothetical protein